MLFIHKRGEYIMDIFRKQRPEKEAWQWEKRKEGFFGWS
jgi:hypothetical protein